MLAGLAERWGSELFKTVVHRTVSGDGEAGETLWRSVPEPQVAQEYKDLARELVLREA